MKLSRLVLILLLVLGMTGCASRGYVEGEVAAVQGRLDDVVTQVEDNQTRIDEQEQRIDEVTIALEDASQTAREAYERAQKAGKLAEGKLLYETVLAGDDVRFAFDKSELDQGSMTALDKFAGDLVTRNESVYIEVQGHTDATGADDYNLELGYERSQAVMRYLNMRHGLPLHRMSAISYGETAPVADNKTLDGRRKNRRVVLVVLK